MTKPGKRTTSLRRLTDEETHAGAGGWVDESFDAAAVNKALDGALAGDLLRTFHSYFGAQLGIYRAREESRADELSVSQEQRLVDELVEYLDELKARLKHLPPRVRMHARTVTKERLGKSYRQFAGEIEAQLRELFNILVLAERKLDPERAQAGAKGKPHRDFLLYSVATWLESEGLNRTKAASLAAAALRAAGVDAPEDPKESARLVRAVAAKMT